MSFRLSTDKLTKLISELTREYIIYAPALVKGQGAFAGTDIIAYQEINDYSEIIWTKKTTYSPKEIVFPIMQILLRFTKQGMEVPDINRKQVLIFLRPCDINGIERLDTIYLLNGKQKDFYYQRLRKKIKFVMIECTKSFENCFCVSMQANISHHYSMAIRYETNKAEIKIQDQTLEKHFSDLTKNSQFEPQFVKMNKVKVKLPNQKKITKYEKNIFNDQIWLEYQKRCIACGRCNITCVTCACFNTVDVIQDEQNALPERRRIWTGCHIDRFTDMASGHAFRKDNGSRMRFKIMHKIYDFNKRFGKHMCVGCGRCDDNCPEYINFAACVNKVTKLVGALPNG